MSASDKQKYIEEMRAHPKHFPTDIKSWMIKSSNDETLYEQHPSFPNAQNAKLVIDDQGSRIFIRYAQGTTELTHTHSKRLEWIVISGEYEATNPITKKTVTLKPGDYWCVPAGSPHTVKCTKSGTFFVMLSGMPDFIPFEE